MHAFLQNSNRISTPYGIGAAAFFYVRLQQLVLARRAHSLSPAVFYGQFYAAVMASRESHVDNPTRVQISLSSEISRIRENNMTPVEAPPGISREDFISFTLRQCALSVDPRYGKLSSLAQSLDMHESTLHVWVRNGRIPKKAARILQRKFGKKLANAEILSEKP